MPEPDIRIVDLFAGLGGIRLGFTQAFTGYNVKCVLTSEIKKHAVSSLARNFPDEEISGDVSLIKIEDIPDFDFLLAGFPCQPFSHAGKREGFADTRGTLFFEIERILAAKKPYGFILENVEGLVRHDLVHPKDPIGRTLATIIGKLEQLGYQVSYKVLDASSFGVPQARKRIYIVGTKSEEPVNLESFPVVQTRVGDFLEKGKPVLDTKFTRLLLQHYTISELMGKAIKDKRGGENNIHSWDFGWKGEVTKEQRVLLEKIFKERRKKHWAVKKGIPWMDGMPLTVEEIRTFHDSKNLEKKLDDLVTKGYLVKEHPKTLEQGKRVPDKNVPAGYNIVSGKLSFPLNLILHPDHIAPTLVASDMDKVGVVDGKGIRLLTVREGLRMFGFPEDYTIEEPASKAYDLLGNSVAVPVVRAVAERVREVYEADSYR